VAVLRDPGLPAGIGQLGAIQAVAPSLRIEVSAVNVRDRSQIERAVAAFARAANAGLIVTQSALATIHRELIVNSRSTPCKRRERSTAAPTLQTARF
jgi:putative ABC transport system substrate-binding protein